MLARYILCHSRSVSNGSSPITTCARPHAVVCENGPSIAPLAAIGLESTSPMPVMPASVSTRTIKIVADSHLRQAARCSVRERAFDSAFGGHRVGVHFADAGDACVGLHAHDQRVLAAVAQESDVRLAEIDGLHTGDLHTTTCSCECACRRERSSRIPAASGGSGIMANSTRNFAR